MLIQFQLHASEIPIGCLCNSDYTGMKFAADWQIKINRCISAIYSKAFSQDFSATLPVIFHTKKSPYLSLLSVIGRKLK